MAVLDLEFQNFLKESRDLHEKLHPGSLFFKIPNAANISFHLQKNE